MSGIYGAEHLLRMIGMHQFPIITVSRKLQQIWYAVSLPTMIGSSNMDPETVNVIRDYVHELMGCVTYCDCTCQTHARVFVAIYQLHGPRSRSYISTGVRDGKFTVPTYSSNVNQLAYVVKPLCMLYSLSQLSPFFLWPRNSSTWKSECLSLDFLDPMRRITFIQGSSPLSG